MTKIVILLLFSYADVRIHLRKEHGFDEEESESPPLENISEKSCTNSSICQPSPTWAMQLATGIPGSSSGKIVIIFFVIM